MAEHKIEKYGLVGKNIAYSFSQNYFATKFKKEQLQHCSYQNFDITSLTDFTAIATKTPDLIGLNITIPYKETVIPFLDKLSKKALAIGAVNTVKITKKKKLKGYNTDYYGFKKSIKPFLKPNHKKALILGTGGASKAVAYALQKMKIDYSFVSRNPIFEQLGYEDLNKDVLDTHHIVINCTPLGTAPKINEHPPIPYSLFTINHLAFDLIYNPAETTFLKRAKQYGAVTLNGYEMLVFQAEKAWEIWRK